LHKNPLFENVKKGAHYKSGNAWLVASSGDIQK